MARDTSPIYQYGVELGAFLKNEKPMIKFPAHELIFGYEEIPEMMKNIARFFNLEIPFEKIGILSMVRFMSQTTYS